MHKLEISSPRSTNLNIFSHPYWENGDRAKKTKQTQIKYDKKKKIFP